MLIAEKQEEQGPIDHFKANRVPKPKKKDITEKAFTKNFVKGAKVPPNKRVKTNQRWTEVELRYNKNKNRVLDVVQQAADLPDDYKPLFSSFNPNKVFEPPPSSKQMMRGAKQRKPSMTHRPSIQDQNAIKKQGNIVVGSKTIDGHEESHGVSQSQHMGSHLIKSGQDPNFLMVEGLPKMN
mmetsp:Transcript_25607/g.39402  ORF Transcript_25607/g.39402 Transcript_25607/m.39402 type:complete len:181 (+) Transcript_25607:1396-1938(+)